MYYRKRTIIALYGVLNMFEHLQLFLNGSRLTE